MNHELILRLGRLADRYGAAALLVLGVSAAAAMAGLMVIGR